MPTPTTSLSKIRIRSYEDLDAWDRFVSTHPQGSIFHTKAIIEAHRQTPGHEPMAICVTDQLGQILGLMTAIRIVTPGPWPERYATRSVAFAEPLVAPKLNDDQRQLILGALIKEHDQRWSERVLFTEIRPVHPGESQSTFLNHGFEYCDYDNYELDLTQGEDAIFRGMCHQRRNNIRANERRGLSVKEVDWRSYLDTFYEHVCHSYSRSQIPVASKEHFHSVFEQLGSDQLRVTSAELGGVPIASAAHFIFQGRIYWWSAGTLRVKGIAPQASLVWEVIQWGVRNSSLVYDFAGAGWSHERYAPGVFKSRFGGKKVNCGRYRKVYSKLRMKVAETGFQLFRPMFSSTKSLPSDNRLLAHNRSNSAANPVVSQSDGDATNATNASAPTTPATENAAPENAAKPSDAAQSHSVSRSTPASDSTSATSPVTTEP